VSPSHHAQDPGYLAGRHLSHPILEDYVPALVHTGEDEMDMNRVDDYVPELLPRCKLKLGQKHRFLVLVEN
jgi:hypothetical protein